MRSVLGLSTLVLSSLLTGACWSASASPGLPQPAPQTLVDQLLDADRAFARGGAGKTAVAALTPMFAPDVIAPGPGGLARGLQAVTDALGANPANTTGTLEWAPIRGGISADGLHGFTFGYMTMRQPDGSTTPLKYLAYWVKRDGRWQVAGYKRRPRPAGDVDTTLLSASLPSRLESPTSNTGLIASHRTGLIAAEQAFSDEAQRIGLGAAFAKHGLPDAMNMGGPQDAAFVIGNATIGANVGAGSPTDSSPVFWSADEAYVATSGDLGVTFGYIRSHAVEGQPARPAVPFFTVWRKVAGVWKYVAE